jgi:hypothetical protein
MSNQDDPRHLIATMQMASAPTEREKAGARLMQAAFMLAMGALQQGANTLAAMAGVNDLSFRRDAGKLDLSAGLDDADGERVTQLLMEAALDYAAAVAAEVAAETGNPP